MDYIEPIRKELEENLHEQCVAFMLIGTKRESPRYINFRDFDMNTKVLRMQSTQTESVFFEIDTPFEIVDVTDFWEQFKEFRTEFLQNNYPTIKTN